MVQYYKCPHCGEDNMKNVSEAREHIRNCPRRKTGELIENHQDFPKGTISFINIADPVEIALNKNECPECKAAGIAKYTYPNAQVLGIHRWHAHKVAGQRKRKKNKAAKSPKPVAQVVEPVTEQVVAIPDISKVMVHICMPCKIIWDFSDDYNYCPRCGGVTVKMEKKQLRCKNYEE